MKLKCDIYSQVKSGRLYGAADARVVLVADHGNVMIVADENNFRFPVHAGNLVNDEEKAEASEKIDHSYKKVPVRTKHKKSKQESPTLFV